MAITGQQIQILDTAIGAALTSAGRANETALDEQLQILWDELNSASRGPEFRESLEGQGINIQELHGIITARENTPEVITASIQSLDNVGPLQHIDAPGQPEQPEQREATADNQQILDSAATALGIDGNNLQPAELAQKILDELHERREGISLTRYERQRSRISKDEKFERIIQNIGIEDVDELIQTARLAVINVNAGSTVSEPEAGGGEEPQTREEEYTVFVAQGTVQPSEHIRTIEAALPHLIAMAQRGGVEGIPELRVTTPDGYLDADEASAVDLIVKDLRAQANNDPTASAILAADIGNDGGYSTLLGTILTLPQMRDKLNEQIANPENADIKESLEYARDNITAIVGAMGELKATTGLGATPGNFVTQTRQVPIAPAAPSEDNAAGAAGPEDDTNPEGGPEDTNPVAGATTTTTTTTNQPPTPGQIAASIARIEMIQGMAYEAINEMSPFFADLMDRPTADGNFDAGERRNLAAMVMLMKKMGGETNPNGEYNAETLGRLRDALLTEDSFEMLRGKLQGLGIERINEGDSPEEIARKKKAADEALFDHLLVLQQSGNTDPNASNVTMANLAFDKIRDFLPDWVKNMMQNFFGTGIGKMIMGVAAAKGVNLERLWTNPEDDPNYNETNVLQEAKSVVLAREYENYIKAAAEELGFNPDDVATLEGEDFANVLAKAQENLVNDIDNNNFNRVGRVVLGDTYDSLRDDLKTAIAATSGAANLEEAKTRLVESVSGIEGVNLDALVRQTETVRQQSAAYQAGEPSSFSSLRGNAASGAAPVVGDDAGEPDGEPIEENQGGAAGDDNQELDDEAALVNGEPASLLVEESNPQDGDEASPARMEVPQLAEGIVGEGVETAPDALPVINEDEVDPSAVSTLGSEESQRGVVFEYERDPNDYVIRNVESEGRVRAILEAISAMNPDSAPYDTQDLIRRTNDSGEIIDLAYKEHNGAFEKIAIAAQLDHMISRGDTTISLNDIEHQVTTENLPLIESFLRKHGVDGEVLENGMEAARSLIDQEVEGKSVMATFFGNWDQIRVSEIRALVEEIAPPDTEIRVIEDPVEPKPEAEPLPPFDPNHMSLDRKRGDYDLQTSALPQIPVIEPVLQKTFEFEAGPVSAPIPCILGSAIMADGGVQFKTSSSCRATSDMPGFNGDSGGNRPHMNSRVEPDPNDPYGRGRVVPTYTPLGIRIGATDFDFRVDTNKDSGAKENDEDRADSMFGNNGSARNFNLLDITRFRGVKPMGANQDSGLRTLAQEVIETYYDGRETLDDAGLLRKDNYADYEQSVRYTDALDRAATMQMNILRNPPLVVEVNRRRPMTRDEQVAKVHEIRDQIHEYLERVTNGTPQPEEINIEELFSGVTGRDAVRGYKEGIKDHFERGPLRDMALGVLEKYNENVEEIYENEERGDITPQEARAMIAEQLDNLHHNLDIIDTVREMIGPEGVAQYKAAVDTNMGTGNMYSQEAYQAIDAFAENSFDDILSDGDNTMQVKIDEVLAAFRTLNEDVDGIYVRQQQAEYDLKHQAADIGVMENGADLAALAAENVLTDDPAARALPASR